MRCTPARGRARVSVPRLLTSAAIAGSVAAAASEAEAVMIQYDLNAPDGIEVFRGMFELDIDGDSVNDFRFVHNYGGQASLIEGLLGQNVVWTNVGTPQFAEPFTDESFNQTTASATVADFYRRNSNAGNPWLLLGTNPDGSLVDGYVNGLFADSSLALHQFWVRLSVNQDLRGALVLKEVAWETDGQPPATTVPEPATLALLALGAAGVAAVRRRASR
jgi:hypothetical protein